MDTQPAEVVFAKADAVRQHLAPLGQALVAFSGGIDSTLLAYFAREVLGKANAIAVTADSPSLAREDLADAINLARQMDLAHEVIRTREMDADGYRANTGNRCYFCKQALFSEMVVIAKARGFRWLLYGAIADDWGDDRPGQRAAQEEGILAPLQDAELSKVEIRRLARHYGLPNWDRPQNACLSSRIAIGEAVSADKLTRIEEAETLMRRAGFRQVRVRHLADRAIIEVGPDELVRLQDRAFCEQLIAAVRACGFTQVEVDPKGYRPSGGRLRVPGAVL